MAQMPKLRKAGEVSRARVLLVDDQPIVRKGLAHLIGSEPDLALCGEADDPRTVFHLATATKPDLIVTGLSFKHSHGLEFLKDLRVRCPAIPVLVFSMYDESLYAERAIRAGASGFLTKREPTEEVLRAIRRVLAGEIYLSERLAAHSLQRFFARSPLASDSELDQLSDRELQVFESIGQGRSSRQIAAALRLDLKTVETYRSRIKVKLKLDSGADLVRHAQRSLQDTTSPRTRSQQNIVRLSLTKAPLP
jgi:DNA-binding NarL/FixJ family response regulator